MLQKVTDYMKCAVRNKLVIGGYAGIGCAFLINYFEHKTGTQLPFIYDALCYSSSAMLGLSRLGIETYNAYTRVKEHIGKYGTIDERFRDKFSPLYCTQTGIRLAAEEAGLEHLL